MTASRTSVLPELPSGVKHIPVLCWQISASSSAHVAHGRSWNRNTFLCACTYIKTKVGWSFGLIPINSWHQTPNSAPSPRRKQLKLGFFHLSAGVVMDLAEGSQGCAPPPHLLCAGREMQCIIISVFPSKPWCLYWGTRSAWQWV